MALTNKTEIEAEVRHSMMLSDDAQAAVMNVLRAADSADEQDLEKMQEILQMIADSEYKEPSIL